METRGPILIATSLSIVVSMVVFSYLQNQQTGEAPTNIQTVGAEYSDCQARGVATMFGRLGCSTKAKVSNRRTTSGGAIFLTVGN